MPGPTVRNWSAEKLEVALGVYMTWQGVSVLVSGRSGINSPSLYYIKELGTITNIHPVVILSMLFLLPGVLIIASRFRRLGLFVATMFMVIHAVGTARSVTLFENGAVTAPNTYAFIAFIAGWLFITERYANRERNPGACQSAHRSRWWRRGSRSNQPGVRKAGEQR